MTEKKDQRKRIFALLEILKPGELRNLEVLMTSAPAERGQSHQVWRNHYTIDRNTANGIEPSVRWMREKEFPVVGVMFYFHTLYYGRDELFLTAEERAPIIDQLLGCIRAGLPVISSRAGLLALKPGDWTRRVPSAHVADGDGEYVCCRACDDTCADCGYAACTEITEFQHLRPRALLGMARYW